ncbi:hydrolase [Mycobacterium colombiense]|uniref:alpha/beta fold hydrolase n=1 Tax=Mycobacterium colombiense TaxID=339268 RepID=UPI0007EF68C7|nr:alpha/beta hydrolase [Mycobacterium colombiense]OBK68574.1 hydrolase [Mycobacterium colombiense]
MENSVVIDDVEIEYADTGSGPPVVFVHGVYVTGALWEDVARLLSSEFRCVVPTWPFGAQRNPLATNVEIGVTAAGRRIVKFIEALDLSDVTLVANDTGGGIVLAALGNELRGCGRVSRLVFTNCDSFENFPPPGFAPLVKMCRFNATLGAAMLRLLATGSGLNMFAKSVTRHGIDGSRQRTIFGGFAGSAQVRRDAVRLTADLSPEHTLTAISAIEDYEKPVLIAWGDSDKLFPMADAQRLADTFPNATLHTIGDSSTYVMLDQPVELAEAITTFVKSPA